MIQKVLCLLFVCSQTTCVLAQHYSGRHVDDYDGGGSGGFIFIIVIIIAVGVFLHFYLLDRDSLPKSSSFTPKASKEKEPMSIDEIYRRESERIDNMIRQNERNSKEASWGCGCFLCCLAFFLIVGLRSSCTNDSNADHPVNSSHNNNNPLNKSGESTSSPSTENNGKKMNDLKSIMQYINEDKQQTDNKGE